MIKSNRRLLVLLPWLICALLGWALLAHRDRNDKPRYGRLGLPENCHALVASNLIGYHSKQYTADEALASIERNCGLLAPMWRE